jgi:cobalamin transport system substrate-binding protein
MPDGLPRHARRSLLLTVLVSVCACTDGSTTDGSTSESRGPGVDARWNRPLGVRVDDPFPRTFTNLQGESYVIASPPMRIASSTLFTDAVLLAICPKGRIAALHEVSKKPMFSPVAQESQAFPRHLTPNPESVLAVRPDLVFLASFSNKKMQQLVSGANRTVIRLHHFQSIAGVQQSIRAVGYITDLDREAERLVETMQARLDAVAKGKEKRRAWRVLSWVDGFAAGRDTIFDDVLSYVGATNLAAEAGLVGARRVGLERVLAMKPDALVIGVLPGQEEQARRKLLRLNGMASLSAVQRKRIVFVPNCLLLSTTHHLAGAVEVIARTLDRWGQP